MLFRGHILRCVTCIIQSFFALFTGSCHRTSVLPDEFILFHPHTLFLWDPYYYYGSIQVSWPKFCVHLWSLCVPHVPTNHLLHLYTLKIFGIKCKLTKNVNVVLAWSDIFFFWVQVSFNAILWKDGMCAYNGTTSALTACGCDSCSHC